MNAMSFQSWIWKLLDLDLKTPGFQQTPENSREVEESGCRKRSHFICSLRCSDKPSRPRRAFKLRRHTSA